MDPTRGTRMSGEPKCKGPSRPKRRSLLSRRGFLGLAAAAVAGEPLQRAARAIDVESATAPPSATRWSRVVRIRDPHVLDGIAVRRPVLGDMFERSLLALTERPSVAEAWASLLRADDVVGIKFNRSGQDALGTTPAVADVLVASLIQAGWSPQRIVCIEAPSEVSSRLGTTPAIEGFSAVETDFGSGTDRLAAVLDQITAIINVPFLKTHNIATLTCALKNLSHGLIKHPARYHRNGCSPYITDIVALPAIRTKLRLCVVDALRVVFEGGPEVRIDDVRDHGVLLLSPDPVATDVIGLATLNQVRTNVGLDAVRFPNPDQNYLGLGGRQGLGMAEWHAINLVEISG